VDVQERRNVGLWLLSLGLFAPLAAVLAVGGSDTTAGWSNLVAPLAAAAAVAATARRRGAFVTPVAVATFCAAYVYWIPVLVLVLVFAGPP
jgi:hypothetical protein